MFANCLPRCPLLFGALMFFVAACASSDPEPEAVSTPGRHDAAVVTVIGYPGARLDAGTVLLDAGPMGSHDAALVSDGSRAN